MAARVAKQRIYSDKGGWFCTPLHIAAEYGNVTAIELLLNGGANIDECDSNYLSPLECILLECFADEFTKDHKKTFHQSKAIDAAVRLIQLRAATGVIVSHPAMVFLEALNGATELSELLFKQTPTASHTQAPPVIDIAHINTYSWELVFQNDLSQLHNLAPELEEDFGGKSLMHEAISWRGFSALPPCWNDALPTITPFPWHYYWPGLYGVAFLTTSFKLYRRHLPHDTFKRILNLQPERGMSPLCRASSRGMLEVMENCLTMNAEIDFEGCSLGSAMMMACACGRLDAVKLLVRRGAAICYVGKKGLASAVIAGRRSKAVIAWLLVGQFNEQKRLKHGDQASSSDGVHTKVQLWSGIGKAHFRLVGRHQMQRHESSLDFAVRLSNLKRKLRGSIIPGKVFFTAPREATTSFSDEE